MYKNIHVLTILELLEIVKKSDAEKVKNIFEGIPSNYFNTELETNIYNFNCFQFLDVIRDFEKFHDVKILENESRLNVFNSVFYISCINQLSELESYNHLYHEPLTNKNKKIIIDEIEDITKYLGDL